jgi:hypothetical protein
VLKKIYKKTLSKYNYFMNNHKALKKFRIDFSAFKDELERDTCIGQPITQKAAAVLLSYKRPKNLQWISKSLLKTNLISRIIVSNNNPDIRMEDWFDFTDSRLEFINQNTRRRAGYRFEIAKDLDDEYFIFIDDDLFLTPFQITTVFNALLSNPSVPHGVWGQRFWKNGEKISWQDGISNYDGELDVINRTYFLTRLHVNKFTLLIKELGLHSITDLKFGDDIILSFSGDKRPICHDVGFLLNCPTKDSISIAIWKENEFFSYRTEMYEKLLSIRNE